MRRAFIVLAALLPAGPRAASAAADGPPQVTIYRCTDAAGHVTLQNGVACPAGTRQERRLVDVPPPLPAYVAREARMPDVVAAEEAREARRIARAVPDPVPPGARTPPPPLYQCTTWDDVRYLTEEASPQSHCKPLRVVGIAGRTPAASACEQVADTCTAVPGEALCHAWKQRVDEAEFRWKFAGEAADANERLEFETLRATYGNTTCND